MVVEPIWPTRTETASRIRGRIENNLDWAAVRGLRSGVNPARWRRCWLNPVATWLEDRSDRGAAFDAVDIARIAALSAVQLPTAITRCPHMEDSVEKVGDAMRDGFDGLSATLSDRSHASYPSSGRG